MKNTILFIFNSACFTGILLSCTSNHNTHNELVSSNQTEAVNEVLAADNNKEPLVLTSSYDCQCSVISYVTKCPKEGVQLFDNQNNVVQSVFFDADNEDFLTVEISELNAAKAKIKWLQKSDDFEANNQVANLWIASSHLQIFLPDNKTKVSLYVEPIDNSSISKDINPFEVVNIQLLNCCENWIFGRFTTKNGDKLEGWLHPDDFCSNPLTNC